MPRTRCARISLAAPQHVIEHQSANSQAYESLLRGNFHLNAPGVENGRKAVAAYQQAIAIDPDYALAHAKLSQSYRTLVNLRRRRSAGS